MRHLSAAGPVVALFSISACATPSFNYVPTVQDISRPPLGSVVTVGVGEQMLVQGRLVEREALQLDRQVRVGVFAYTFTPGHFARVGGEGSKGYYHQSSIPGSGLVQQSALADPFKVMEYDSESRRLCGVSIFNMKVCTTAPTAKLTTISSESDNSFQQTLIYSGRVGDKINVGYREFSADHARPAFSNDVEYDLSESNTIGYRGAELEIIGATNRSITYRVVKNFNFALQ